MGDFVEQGDMVGIELLYFVDTDDEKVIPVFTSHERLEEYVRTDLDTPEGHLDMMEGGNLTRARALSEGRFQRGAYGRERHSRARRGNGGGLANARPASR